MNAIDQSAAEAPPAMGRHQPHLGEAPVDYKEDEFFKLSTIRAFLWRQRWVLIIVTGLAVIAGLIATMLMTPIYSASATVRVTLEPSRIVEGGDLLDPSLGGRETNAYMATLGEVITSRSMALRVVESLKLHENSNFMGPQDAEQQAGLNPKALVQQRKMVAATILMNNVTVTVPTTTRIVTVTFDYRDPELAADIVNSYVQNLILYSATQGVEANNYARTYLDDQISQVRQRLGDAEQQAINYARSNRIIGSPMTAAPAADGEDEAGTAPTLTATNLTEINQAYTDARTRRIAAEQRWRAIADLPAAQLPEVQQNSTISGLRSQIGTIQADLTRLRERYRADYPEIVELTARLRSLERQIATTSSEIKQGIRNALTIAEREEQALQAELERVSDQTLDEQDRRVQYNLIDRDVQALRIQLASLLERYNQLSAAANLRSNDISGLDQATVPGMPSSPNLLKNLLIALLLGAGLAGAIAFIREMLDDKLRSVEDIETKLGVPALGQTPYVPHEVWDEMGDDFSPISEAYSSVRATLDFSMGGIGKNRVIQVTSSEASEGKTTTSIALARKYALIGRKVLLVEMDLRRPRLARVFNMTRGETGLVDVLYSRVPMERAIMQDVNTNLDVLPLGAIPSNPVEILSSGLMAEFLIQCREKYELVILDSSPVMGIADAPLLSRFADAVVFVIEANRAHYGHSKASIRRLRDLGANIVGVVLTKFRALDAGQDYSYQYRYYTYSANEDSSR